MIFSGYKRKQKMKVKEREIMNPTIEDQMIDVFSGYYT